MRYIFFLFIPAGLVACFSRDPNPYTNNLGIPPAEMALMDTANYTIIEWKDSVQNFGTVVSGDTILINFSFKNAGNTPLFISSVSTECGCTIIHYPKNLIVPGKSGKIAVSFAAGKTHGQSYVRRGISVKTNTKNGVYHRLVLYGEIKPDTGIIKK